MLLCEYMSSFKNKVGNIDVEALDGYEGNDYKGLRPSEISIDRQIKLYMSCTYVDRGWIEIGLRITKLTYFVRDLNTSNFYAYKFIYYNINNVLLLKMLECI